MIIQFFTEKHFSTNFRTTDPLNMVEPTIFSSLIDLHTDNPLVANKYTKNIKWAWIGLNDATWRIFPEVGEKLLKNHMKNHMKSNFWKRQHNSFPMRGYSSKMEKSGSEIRAIQMLGDQKADISKKFQPHSTDAPRHGNSVKLLGNV